MVQLGGGTSPSCWPLQKQTLNEAQKGTNSARCLTAPPFCRQLRGTRWCCWTVAASCTATAQTSPAPGLWAASTGADALPAAGCKRLRMMGRARGPWAASGRCAQGALDAGCVAVTANNLHGSAEFPPLGLTCYALKLLDCVPGHAVQRRAACGVRGGARGAPGVPGHLPAGRHAAPAAPRVCAPAGRSPRAGVCVHVLRRVLSVMRLLVQLTRASAHIHCNARTWAPNCNPTIK